MPVHEGEYCGFETAIEDPGILVVTFNRPESLNASTAAMKRDLVELLTQTQMDDTIRIVVFTGQGQAFWAGDDLKGYSGDSVHVPPIHHGHHNPSGTYNGLRTISQAVNTAVRNLDKISIAAINGFAIQPGFPFAWAGDFRSGARAAKWGRAPLTCGLWPDEGGQWLLVQHLGVAKAMDFMMRKRIVDGETAFELGLVHEVVPDNNLMEETLTLARELADGPQVAMRMLKRSILLAADLTWDQSLDEIAAKTAVTDHLPDAREGASAFIEKRQPRFNGWLEGRADPPMDGPAPWEADPK